MQKVWDRVGMTLSFVCVLHCMALPFIFLMIPTLSEMIETEKFHIIMVFSVTATAGISFIPGYLRHKDTNLMWLVFVGLLFVVGGIVLGHELGELFERVITSIGSILLMVSHYKNLKHKSCCHPCNDEEQNI
jgi:hypothetical protein